MKKLALGFSVLFIALKLSAQTTFVGFDQPICSAPMVNTYTYLNYSLGSGSGSGVDGYKIFRNGIQVYDISGSMQFSESCKNLIFINDSTGFAVGASGFGIYVLKTSNYGNTWSNIGSGPGTPFSGYFGLYVVNANFAYLVTLASSIYVVRCTDIDPPTWPAFIYDNSINVDIFKTDSIIGCALCNIDSLNILIKNSIGDTIDYHIDFFCISVPLGVNELQQPSNFYTAYPNPAHNTLCIKGDEYSISEIYNANGEKIYEGNSKTINIEAFSKGIYFLRIINQDGKSYNSKFFKE